MKPYEGTILTSGKVCCVQYLLVFRLISDCTGKRLIPALRRKDPMASDRTLRALLLAVTNLWPKKVGSRGEIYSAKWKLMLISDQVKDLDKNWFEGGGLHVSFFNRWCKSGILNKSALWVELSVEISWVVRKCCDCRKGRLLCDLSEVLTDNLRYVVWLVLPENFVPA